MRTGGRAKSSTGLRAELVDVGRRWAVSLVELVRVATELDQSGDWAWDGSATCAHWIAAALDVEVCTAREWLRVGRALTTLPLIQESFEQGRLTFSKARSLTRIATAENEADLCELAERTPAGKLSLALASWSAENEDEGVRDRRHRQRRGLRLRTEPDGMVSAVMRMTPEQSAVFGACLDAAVRRRDGRDLSEGENLATGATNRHGGWLSLAQQRIDAVIELVSGGGAALSAEVILHVRGNGCTLDDGTPIAGSIVERIATDATLRAMIHDADRRPINVSGRHRRHTTRQKLVVKERDRCCVDCGSGDLLEYAHEPPFEESRRTLVEETELRCWRCHRARHARRNGSTA